MKKLELEKLYKKIDFQKFADGEGEGAGDGEGEGAGTNAGAGEGEGEKLYTDEEVNKLIARKKAEWEKKSAKNAKNNNATLDEEVKSLRETVESYKKALETSQRSEIVRTVFNEKKISVPNAIINSLITDDDDETKENAEKFAKAYADSLKEALKNSYKGSGAPAGAGGGGKLTKADILKVRDKVERQRLIKENADLFK